MIDANDLLGVVHAHLFHPDGQERHSARLALADLFEEAGDEAAAARLRGFAGYSLWAVPAGAAEREDLLAHADDVAQAVALCERKFGSPLERQAWASGYVAGGRPTDQALFETAAQCHAALALVWGDMQTFSLPDDDEDLDDDEWEEDEEHVIDLLRDLDDGDPREVPF